MYTCLRKIPSTNVSTMCEPTMLHKLGTSWSVHQTEWPLCLVGEHDFYETSVLISDRAIRPCQSAYADCINLHCLQAFSILPAPGYSALMLPETPRSLCITKSTLLQMPRDFRPTRVRRHFWNIKSSDFMGKSQLVFVKQQDFEKEGVPHSFWGVCCAGR